MAITSLLKEAISLTKNMNFGVYERLVIGAMKIFLSKAMDPTADEALF